MPREYDSSDDEQQTSGRKKRKLIHHNEEKEKCRCRKGCSKRSCSCFKSTNGCNSLCKCKSSCQNLFNHLDYFFGENSQCSANPCFTDWLIKNAKTVDGLQKIDHEELHKKIFHSDR
jgi:hypothetical protein